MFFIMALVSNNDETDTLEQYVNWRRFSNTFISSNAYMRGPVKIQVIWHKISILAENTLHALKILK